MIKKPESLSPFLWEGKPSIFSTGKWNVAQNFKGTNTARAAGQTRLEPRPTHIVADSIYMKQPRIGK